MSNTIDVGRDFYPRLANRDKHQGDGKHTAVEFRAKYLGGLDNKAFWTSPRPHVTLDFSNVKKIGPSFANEAFAYFTKYADPSAIMKVIEVVKASRVQMGIILEELDSGYKGK